MLSTGLDDPRFSFIFLERQEWEPFRKGFARQEINDYLMRVGGTMMPPSVFTDELTARYYITGRPPVVHLEANWKVTPEWKKVVGAWNDLHGYERSRQMQAYRSQLAFSCGALRANELERRISKVKYRDEIDRLISHVRDLRDDITMAWGEMWGRWARELKIGDHTLSYIHEHKDSSVMPGVKWPQLGADAGDLKKAYLCVRDTYEVIAENWEQCLLTSEKAYVAAPQLLYSGERSRSPDDFKGEGASSFAGEVTRSRIIKFHLALSGFWAFHPNPIRCYKEWMAYLQSKVSFKIVCPVVEGGATWGMIYDRLDSGSKYINVDASGWDTHYPWVLNIGGPVTTVYDAEQGGSGFAPTSQGGSGAQVVMDEALVQTVPYLDPDMVGVLGDDGAWVLPEGCTATPEVPGINEIDVVGTELRHYLGLSMLDEECWHPTGFKATVDRAGRGARMRPMEQLTPLLNTYSDAEKAIIVGVYVGRLPDGRSIRTVLAQTDLSELDYISPSTIRGQIMSDALESGSDLEQVGDDRET